MFLVLVLQLRTIDQNGRVKLFFVLMAILANDF